MLPGGCHHPTWHAQARTRHSSGTTLFCLLRLPCLQRVRGPGPSPPQSLHGLRLGTWPGCVVKICYNTGYKNKSRFLKRYSAAGSCICLRVPAGGGRGVPLVLTRTLLHWGRGRARLCSAVARSLYRSKTELYRCARPVALLLSKVLEFTSEILSPEESLLSRWVQ